MKYYELIFLKSPLSSLTYQSEENLDIGQKVLVSLGRRKKLSEAVILKDVEKPKFKCINIDEITTHYFDKRALEIANFISQYYVCSLGVALSIFIPFDKKVE